MFLAYGFALCKNISILFNFPSLFLKSAREEIKEWINPTSSDCGNGNFHKVFDN